MKDVIFLFSKDAMPIENLPIYGNKYWETPNIDALAAKGTVFYNHHTSAASTSMVFSSMLTGKYAHEFSERKRYIHVKPNEHRSIFNELQEKGYDCHILWSSDYMTGAWPYVREFGDEEKTKIHIVDMHQPAGQHRKKGEELCRSEVITNRTYETIIRELESIEIKGKQFIWLHLPHVLKGRISYGDDVDVVDRLLGYVREKYGDENIYFTSDHGHMNFHKNIMGYGFHVYEPTCKVPLITPRINGIERVDDLTSHVDLIKILLGNEIVKREYVFVDSQYYTQPDRKLAVIGRRFKYIYNKRNDTEELYDLMWDQNERFNLLEGERYDEDKKLLRNTKELYFYPYFLEAEKAYTELKCEKDKIWRKGTMKEEMYSWIRNEISKIKRKRVALKQRKEL